jgi:hypothetical protein
VIICDTTYIGADLALCMYIQQHIWDRGRSDAGDHKGQVGKENVHGFVQLGVRDGGRFPSTVSR